MAHRHLHRARLQCQKRRSKRSKGCASIAASRGGVCPKCGAGCGGRHGCGQGSNSRRVAGHAVGIGCTTGQSMRTEREGCRGRRFCMGGLWPCKRHGLLAAQAAPAREEPKRAPVGSAGERADMRGGQSKATSNGTMRGQRLMPWHYVSVCVCVRGLGQPVAVAQRTAPAAARHPRTLASRHPQVCCPGLRRAWPWRPWPRLMPSAWPGSRGRCPA